jgi:hypothetical protein
MLTTNELRDQLAADVESAPRNVDRTSQVRRRVTLHRRRRAIGSGVASLTVLAVAALVVIPQLGDDSQTVPPAAPSPSPTADAALDDYQFGGLLIAQGEHTGSEPFTVPFTASNRNVMFTVDCYVPGAGDDGHVVVSFVVNDQPQGAMSCDENDHFTGGNSFGPAVGGTDAVHPGRPGSVVVSFDTPVSALSRVRIGVYERVPLASYQFPEAPDPLPPLDQYGNLLPREHKHPLVVVSAGPLPREDAGEPVIVGPTGTWSGTFVLNHGLDIESQTVAPGELHFLVDGKEVATQSGWNYNNSGSSATFSLAKLGIHKGDTVTLTVTAERFPGSSWAVLFSDEPAQVP